MFGAVHGTRNDWIRAELMVASRNSAEQNPAFATGWALRLRGREKMEEKSAQFAWSGWPDCPSALQPINGNRET